MPSLTEIRALVAAQPKPVCVALTPFEIIDADPEAGFVKVEFAAQPAFRNHFGNIQAGFAVAMLDVPLSIAAFLKQGSWLPTVEIKTSFLNPARIGTCIAEARVLKAGKSLAFLEARLWGADAQLAVHATATVAIRPS
ncbi:MAG: PaaI family thioesterase [Deltaproteobacteria bacterium]|nr:PaaI family thioesterase [Deltaproteobacteria bacterium]